jgi:hypothetical protein
MNSGGACPDLPKGWVDQLYHDLKAQGRNRLSLLGDWQQSGRSRTLTDGHKRAMREGLQRYHERRRAGGA